MAENSESNLTQISNLFEKIDMGLVVIKDNMIEYKNEIFNNRIVRRLKQNRLAPTNPIDHPLFKLYKIIDSNSNDFNKNKKRKDKQKFKAKIGDRFSLKDLVVKDAEFLNDKVFTIDVNDDTSSFFNLEQTYKYVHLKLKPIEAHSQ